MQVISRYTEQIWAIKVLNVGPTYEIFVKLFRKKNVSQVSTLIFELMTVFPSSISFFHWFLLEKLVLAIRSISTSFRSAAPGARVRLAMIRVAGKDEEQRRA
jgi:hypothetical protein